MDEQFLQALGENHENEAELLDPPVSQGGWIKRKTRVLYSASQDTSEASGDTPRSSQGRTLA